MSQQNQFENFSRKRNYNEMVNNSIKSASNNDSFIKNQLFKSSLKFGGPINQDLIIHQKKNVRKSMGYKIQLTNPIFDTDSNEKGKKDNSNKTQEIKDKKEEIVDLSNSPKQKKVNFREQSDFFNKTINKNNSNQLNIGIFNSGAKKVNNNNIFNFKTEDRNKNYGSIFLDGDKNNEIKNDEIDKNNNNFLLGMKKIEEDEKNRNKQEEIISNSNEMSKINNPFLQASNIFTNKEQINPFHSNNNSFFVKPNNNKSQIENSNKNNVVENPFLAISKPKIENPFKISNPFTVNNSNNDNNSTNKNPFISNNNNIINPFASSNKNPFSSTSSINSNTNKEQKNNEVKNPFIQNNINNIFASNETSNSNNKIINPFENNYGNIFNTKENNNNSNENNKIINNPFSNNSNNENGSSSNPFNAFNNNPFIMNSSKFQNKNDNEEENLNVEEEVKIEKDENKLKQFKEVKYENKDKFYEIQIDNMQYLVREDGKNKYVSIGPGMLSFQEEKDKNGAKKGIIVLRDTNTKNIRIQGIIIDSSSVEKAELKNGLQFIMMKNILAVSSKYYIDDITQETKLTFIRIRINKDNLDLLFNKAKEFFQLMKK